MAGNSSVPGASVLSRAFALLRAFDADHRGLTLSELARRAEVPLATTHRLVGELVEQGALARQTNGNYVIGRDMWDLGLLAPVQTGLRQIASPFLHDLYGATLSTVHLAVRDGTEALYIDRVSGHSSVSVVSQVGSRLPLHATGVGKVLLAYAPRQVQLEVLTNLTRVTPFTVTQPGRLRADIRRVHKEGFAQTIDEMSLGASSVAVPISGPDATVLAALGIVVPRLRRDRARLIAALQVAASGIGRTITAELTYNDPD